MNTFTHYRLALAAHDRWKLEPPDVPDQPKSSPCPPGYYGFLSNAGIYVEPENALSFALERSGLRVEDAARFELEWGADGWGFEELFYSGNWIRRE